MTTNNTSKNPLQLTVKHLENMQRTKLIGSRYYGNNKPYSDYDFITLHYNVSSLIDYGFSPLNDYGYDNGYELDGLTSEVLRKPLWINNGLIMNVDVQISNSFETYFKKLLLQQFVKSNFLYQLPRQYFRNFIWEVSNLLADSKVDNNNLTLISITIENIVKDWFVDLSWKRFSNLCSRMVKTEITPFTVLDDLIVNPNYECFSYMWNIRFGIA